MFITNLINFIYTSVRRETDRQTET